MSYSSPAPAARGLLERLIALNTQVGNLARKVSREAKSHLPGEQKGPLTFSVRKGPILTFPPWKCCLTPWKQKNKNNLSFRGWATPGLGYGHNSGRLSVQPFGGNSVATLHNWTKLTHSAWAYSASLPHTRPRRRAYTRELTHRSLPSVTLLRAGQTPVPLPSPHHHHQHHIPK